MSIEITNYSEKALVIRGPKEDMPIEQLKQLNAKWNRFLKGGPGWIISKKKEEQVRNLFSSKEENSSEENKLDSVLNEIDDSEDEKEDEKEDILSNTLTREQAIKNWTKNLSEDDKRGIRALILGCKMLSDPGYDLMKGKKYPMLFVYTDTNELIMKINYESPDNSGNVLPKMYKVKEELPNKITKELMFYYDNLKDYLIETIGTERIRIDHIYLYMNDNIYRLFYDQSLGVLWDKTECFKCYKILQEYGINCTYEDCDSDTKQKLKKLYLQHHPDKGGDPSVFQKLQYCNNLVVINECLSNVRHRPPKLSSKKGLWSNINNTDAFGNITKIIIQPEIKDNNLNEKISHRIDSFCSLLRNNKVKDSKELFENIPIAVQRLFLSHCWKILSNKNKYSEDSYKTAFLLFKLFRGQNWKNKAIYKPYLTKAESHYKKAANFFKNNSSSKLSISKTSITKTQSKPKAKSARQSKSKTQSKPKTKPKAKSAPRASKKYDKEYQRFQQPKELDPLYLFYTSLYSQNPKSRLAITWLTEHGVFNGSERTSIVKKYEKLKEAGKLIK